MVASDKSENLSYRVMESRDVNQVVDLFVKTFLAREPISKHLLEPESFQKFATITVKECVDEKLSFVCEDTSLPEEQRIVGFRLCDRFKKNHKENSETDDNALAYFLNLMDCKWREKHPELALKKEEELKILDLVALGVKDGYEGLGIGKKLIQLTLNRAKESGYKLAYVKATAKATQHIFKNHYGFKEVVSLKYEDFEYNGNRMLECLKGLGGVTVFEREL